MPFVTIKMMEGRDVDTKRELCKNVAETIGRQLKLPAENVIVQIEEMKKENYWIGGKLFSDK